MMKRVKRGAVLLVTTVVLSFVVITSGVFSIIYLNYGKMNHNYVVTDKNKISLYQKVNDTYEQFLLDTKVEYNGVSKKIRSEWLERDLLVGEILPAAFDSWTANFKVANESRDRFDFEIEEDKYAIKAFISEDEITSDYVLTIGNFVRRD